MPILFRGDIDDRLAPLLITSSGGGKEENAVDFVFSSSSSSLISSELIPIEGNGILLYLCHGNIYLPLLWCLESGVPERVFFLLGVPSVVAVSLFGCGSLVAVQGDG